MAALTPERLQDEGRCRVCALPLPANAADGICSRRCRGLKRESARVTGEERVQWRARILERVGQLREGTTICPGQLSQELLPGIERPLTLLRPLIFELQEEKKVRLTQKGQPVILRKIRGPFRVRGK